MRIYAPASEDAVRAGRLLRDWVGEGYLTQTQYERLKQETVSDLRTTNIFLRIVLFLFTLISVGAAVALFFSLFLSHSSEQIEGIFLLIFAALSYAATELTASQVRLYRCGIEEALAACSVGFLYGGMLAAFFSGVYYPRPNALKSVVPAVCAFAALWMWRRFGFWYAFPAAMVFVIFLAGDLTSSHTTKRVILAWLYAVGLIVVIAIRSRLHFDSGEDDFSLAEMFLWLGVYLAINLQLPPLELRSFRWDSGYRAAFEFATPFYWTTWVLTWVLPPIVLVRGIRLRDRFVLAVGTIVAVLTFVTNKPYLGWPRHTWDPMLLGILLAGVALCIRRWLAHGPGGIRGGFTAARLSGKDKQWMNVSSAAVGLVTPQSITPTPQTTGSSIRFGGGASGGGGAGGNF